VSAGLLYTNAAAQTATGVVFAVPAQSNRRATVRTANSHGRPSAMTFSTWRRITEAVSARWSLR
jgi:hypothetical protein